MTTNIHYKTSNALKLRMNCSHRYLKKEEMSDVKGP